jgi:hypothetical protein
LGLLPPQSSRQYRAYLSGTLHLPGRGKPQDGVGSGSTDYGTDPANAHERPRAVPRRRARAGPPARTTISSTPPIRLAVARRSPILEDHRDQRRGRAPGGTAGHGQPRPGSRSRSPPRPRIARPIARGTAGGHARDPRGRPGGRDPQPTRFSGSAPGAPSIAVRRAPPEVGSVYSGRRL